MNSHFSDVECHELFHEDFNTAKLLPTRWNHEEIEFEYTYLRNNIVVWKYYLRSLLKDGVHPCLRMKINNPTKLWNELNLKFLSSSRTKERKIILKVMILLYREHNTELQDLGTMPIWLNYLQVEEYENLRYLILQLLYSALVVEDVLVLRANLKRFIELQGVNSLFTLIGAFYHEEDLRKLNDYEVK